MKMFRNIYKIRYCLGGPTIIICIIAYIFFILSYSILWISTASWWSKFPLLLFLFLLFSRIDILLNSFKGTILHHQNALENSGLYYCIIWCILKRFSWLHFRRKFLVCEIFNVFCEISSKSLVWLIKVRLG